MKWLIPGPNAKVLAQAIHCLAKIGEELYVEGRPEKLTFRTVNLSKTAFASINFKPEFFSYFPTVTFEDGPRCQISMKAALVVFRFPSGMERSVESCALSIPTEDYVEFRIKFKQGFVKTNKIQLLESEVLCTSYEDDVLPSKIVVEPKLLSDWLGIFHGGEVTWDITDCGIQLRNFCDLVDDPGGLKSEVVVDKSDILELQVVSDTELTFCLSELRTVVAFAEQLSCPITISFSETGKPIFFIVSCDVLTTHVVLSTLSSSSTQTTINESVPQNQSQRIQQSLQTSSQPTIEQIRALNHILRRPEYDITKLPGYDVILAPDSDEET